MRARSGHTGVRVVLGFCVEMVEMAEKSPIQVVLYSLCRGLSISQSLFADDPVANKKLTTGVFEQSVIRIGID